jgi:CheY-like chemotaxis protein
MVEQASAAASILLVEDETDVREMVADFLTETGYRVIAVANAEEALAQLAMPEPIDLLFTDIVLGAGINGLRLARQAVMLRPSLRVLYATGYAEPLREKEPMLARGDLLNKPYRLVQLEARIAATLSARPYELNRVLRRLWTHWNERRGGRPMPALGDIDLGQIEDIAADVAIAEAVSRGDTIWCRYVYCGARLTRMIGRDPVGLFTDEVSTGEYSEFISRMYRDVVTSGAGTYAASYFMGQESIATERLLLPLSVAGGAAGAVIATQTFDRNEASPTPFDIVRDSSDRRDVIERIPVPNSPRP